MLKWILLILFLILIAVAVWFLLRPPSGSRKAATSPSGAPLEGRGDEPAPTEYPQPAPGEYAQPGAPVPGEHVPFDQDAQHHGDADTPSQFTQDEAEDTGPYGEVPPLGDDYPAHGTAAEHTGPHGTDAAGGTGMSWAEQPDGMVAEQMDAGGPDTVGEQTYAPAGTFDDDSTSVTGAGDQPDHGTSAPAEAGFAEPYGPGSAAPAEDGTGPAGWTIKGNVGSMLFHTEESPSYPDTRAEVWFESEEAAKAAGFLHWDRKRR